MKTILLTVLLAATAAARPGWFGLGFTHHIHEHEQWLVVRAVAPGGPAAKAGLEEGDVITAVNGKALAAKDSVALLEELGKIQAGETVRFAVVRRERKLTLTVTPAPMTGEQFERWKANLENERRRAAAARR
jgi:S1-C subfamily serine protease